MVASKEQAPVPVVTLDFRYLGSFAVCIEGAWHAAPAHKKGGGLIQYLGVYPRRVATREEIAAAFWPALEPEDVEHRIHLAASGARLFFRRLLAGLDIVNCVGNGYAWSPNVRVTSDAARFLDQVRRGTSDGYRAAIECYGGEFLAGETHDWLQPMRVKIAAARAHALETLVEELLRGEQYAAALAFGLDLVEAERGHERATRQVMRAFAALGQRTRAIEQYRQLEMYLAAQIGVEPTPETAALAADIVDGLTGHRAATRSA